LIVDVARTLQDDAAEDYFFPLEIRDRQTSLHFHPANLPR
jgi:hypothetical protein